MTVSLRSLRILPSLLHRRNHQRTPHPIHHHPLIQINLRFLIFLAAQFLTRHLDFNYHQPFTALLVTGSSPELQDGYLYCHSPPSSAFIVTVQLERAVLSVAQSRVCHGHVQVHALAIHHFLRAARALFRTVPFQILTPRAGVLLSFLPLTTFSPPPNHTPSPLTSTEHDAQVVH